MLAVEGLVAVVASRGVVLLAELHEMRLEAGVAAAAEDVCLGVAVALDAEEGVLSRGGHLA